MSTFFCSKPFVLSPVALTNQLLLDGRWMPNGATRNTTAKSMHLWSTILTMTERKQLFFVHRFLLLHEIAQKQVRASHARLTLQQWNDECDKCCLVAHIIEYMEAKTDSNGQRMFDDDVINKLLDRAIEGTLALKSNQSLLIFNVFNLECHFSSLCLWPLLTYLLCFIRCFVLCFHNEDV